MRMSKKLKDSLPDQDDAKPEVAKAANPPGRTLYVCASKFSKPFMTRAAQDFQAGKVQAAMQIILPDGQTIAAGPTYETSESPDLIKMIKTGIISASIFGKLQRKGGKSCPVPKAT